MGVTPLNKQNTSRIAQSFYVNRANGIYVTDVELFFKAVPPDPAEPVYVTIRSLTAGVPTTDVYMAKAERSYSEISPTVSVDGTTGIKFTFPFPVYLDPYASYAFTVETNSAAYEVWYSEIYDYVLNSTEKLVDKNPVTGSLFLSQNGVTWSAVQEQDLKFKIHKANWSNYYTANDNFTMTFQNKALPFNPLFSNPIKTDGTTTFYIRAANHGFQEGDKVKITGVTSASNYVGGIHIDNINYATAGELQIASGNSDGLSRDWTGLRIEAASVQANAALSEAEGGGNTVQIEKNFLYSHCVVTLDKLQPPKTQVSYGVKTTKAGANPFNSQSTDAYDRDTAYSQIKMGKTMVFNEQPRIIAGPTQEADNPSAEIPNNKTFEVAAVLTSDDPENVMPLIDMERANVAVQAAVIDNPSQSTNSSNGLNRPIYYKPETDPLGGTAAAKHITTVFPLEASAVGLKVLIGANRPNLTNFDLYYRVGLDGDDLAAKNWTLQTVDNNPPTDESSEVFREYEYLIGGDAGIDPFDQFQFKIVMTSQNMLKFPRIKDFRAIALGT